MQYHCAGFNRYSPSLWRKLIIRWLCFTPPLHLVGCDTALKVIRWPESVHFQSHILKAQLQQHTIPPQALSRFIKMLRDSQIWSTLAGNILNALSAKQQHLIRTDWKLTINNITQYWWMKCHYLMAFYYLPAGITLSHDSLTTWGAPEWPSTSCQFMIHSLTTYLLDHHLKLLTRKNQ